MSVRVRLGHGEIVVGKSWRWALLLLAARQQPNLAIRWFERATPVGPPTPRLLLWPDKEHRDERGLPPNGCYPGKNRTGPAASSRLSRHVLVFDTSAARYVWEVPYYPQYYIPLADVRMEFLRDENHPQRVQLGPSRLHSLVSAGQTHRSAARVFDVDGDSPVAGTVRFNWDPLRWFEEDEPIYGHPRNPYQRADALRSHRHVRVELDGIVLADTRSPVLLFETGIPTRYYIDPADIAFEHLSPPRRRRCVRTRGRRRAIGLCASATPCTATWPDVSLSTARRCPDRRPGGVLQREGRPHRRRRRPAAAAHSVQLVLGLFAGWRPPAWSTSSRAWVSGRSRLPAISRTPSWLCPI